MSALLTPQPRRPRMPDHSGIRLPLGTLRRRFVPGVPERSAPTRRGPFGGPPLRAA
ncbi:hypothetical protein [Pseudolysinimonas yzui]|uniref:Uncharacterized protein n=1 Tax=Pseudolysinimonas yzui TaxID=2708254 RepID=A0A8J3GPQ8_9MICO|nr:hypothetical protein [Pseudolysinimonas yzui]GHF11742.1 hypothetical protein GCM10011600_11360 [Pseudolysinimonas yzui]